MLERDSQQIGTNQLFSIDKIHLHAIKWKRFISRSSSHIRARLLIRKKFHDSLYES